MANRRITDHTALTGAATASTDLIELIDVSDTTDAASGTNKKQTMAEHAIAIAAAGSLATDAGVSAAVSAHTSDTTDAHAASAITFTPAGSIAATNAQTAIAEVATDAASALSTHESDTTSVHGISDTSILLTTTAHDSRDHSVALSTAVIDDLSDVTITAAASGDILRHNGTAWVDAVGTTHFEVAGAVATHEAGTTSVHGIADTSVLLTTTAAPELIRDTMATALVAGSNITITPDDGADTITIAASGGGNTYRSVLLPVGGGSAPDASGTGNNPATPSRVVSAGTQTANTPKVTYATLLFDQSTDEHWQWQFKLPNDYASGGTLRLGFGAVPTSGNVIWKAGICEFSTSAPVFLAANVSSATAVPADVDDVTEATIALTMTSLAAADEVVLFIGRDADNGSDTAAGDAILITASFEYVAS